ncbi:chemotaxis response regulator protein-glutamate methylesterase [Bacillus sp. AGMB 02131]|uniref:Protein-glutamate methylesterase/protein-glutamine glutaminase n=1 Tax=Peribacillus faecalis TaxID=2772559 RepID=A0A927D1Q6_9BACI|nr:chemotaxis response regulator protein-glutamate methylesterase [Peribacillus faecalis]MBD3109424.1 chemotaxis response regulator protein-glutamate methylesterase [Peribacillus faecalis]
MEKPKVLIVEDSAFMRKLITDFLMEDQSFNVIGYARNGKDAIDKIKQLQPDVVTLDVEMPIMDGLEALKIIMAECPLPVIMLSSSTQSGADNTVLSMQYGAFDFIAKPSGAISLDLHKVKEELKEKITAASKAKISRFQKNLTVTKQKLSETVIYSEIESSYNRTIVPKTFSQTSQKVIAIGTSTGGPRALQRVLTNLPETIDAPIAIVQHMPAGFTKSLANRLDSLSAISVKEVEDSEVLHKGTAYIAPGGYHFRVIEKGKDLVAKLGREEAVNGHRPSVDVLFKSISALENYSVICVIMTGMGNDGSKGLITLKQRRPTISIAESEETSIVFGMPRAAIATNLVDDVENVENIARTIVKYC